MIAIDTNLLEYYHREDSQWHEPADRLLTELITSAEVNNWLASPSLALLHEDLGYWERFSAILDKGKIVGPRVHDARIAALCLDHGVSELWSADRDFSAFAELPSRNPLVE